MTERPQTDICVIGGGVAGFSVAAMAAQVGARVTLIERDTVGGAVLSGAVAARALTAATDAFDSVRRAGRFGIRTGPVAVDMDGVRAHVRRVVSALSPNLSEARLAGLGVTVIKGAARFSGPDSVAVGTFEVRARRFVIAVGSQPLMPIVPGLDALPVLTEQTLLALDRPPERLIVLGGEPGGVACAQAFQRLGVAVTIVAPEGLLAREDPELVAVLRAALEADGVVLIEGFPVAYAEGAAGAIALRIESAGEARRIDGTHLLVNVGRRPVVDGLALPEAGVTATDLGIVVDSCLRTANAKIYAVGECIGGSGLAPAAADHAGVVIRHALFRLPAKAVTAVPRVVLTAPELAQVGLSESEARRASGDLVVLRWPFADNDRAQADRTTTGMIKVLTTRRGRIVGASLVGARAGELVAVWALAVRKGLRIRDIAETPMGYPTLAEINTRVAQSALLPRLMAPLTRRVVRLLGRLD